jgi:hypothetical protein
MNTVMVPPNEASSLMEVIARAASDPNVEVDKLERLLAVYERVKRADAEQLFNAAMTETQKEMRPIAADASNPQTKSKYASYAALDNILRPIYTKHGFGLSFDTGDGAPADHLRVLCYVSHGGGFTRTYKVDMPADGKGAKGGDVMTKTHATGSALTYGQRYLLKAVFNIAVGRDDDGNKAHGGGVISAAQLAEIRKLITETNADIEKFCHYLNVESVVEIAARDYDKAMSALRAKASKK